MAPHDEDMIDVLDELDEIFGDYGDDFGSISNNNKKPDNEPVRRQSENDTEKAPLDLGIDQEVITKKARKLAPKLDENL
jgi:hypothetical protein